MYLHPSYLASLLFQQEIVLDNYSFHFSLSGIIRNLRHLPAQSVIFGHHLPFSSLQTYEPSDNFFVAVLILSVVSTSLMPAFFSLSSFYFFSLLFNNFIFTFYHFFLLFVTFPVLSFLSYLFLSYLFLSILILSILNYSYLIYSAFAVLLLICQSLTILLPIFSFQVTGVPAGWDEDAERSLLDDQPMAPSVLSSKNGRAVHTKVNYNF